MLVDVARAHYTAQAGLSRQAVAALLAIWAELDPGALSPSWVGLRMASRMLVALAAAQLAAVTLAPLYVAAALLQQRAPSAPVARLVPQALAGVASDGRALETLIEQPLIRTKVAILAGATPQRALEVGGSALATIAATQVADAGRAAVDVAMVVEPRVTGWVRMLAPPSCGRCAILAGRFYRISDGFLRHERCDCVHVPSVEDAADDLRTDPMAYFRSLTEAEQDKYFTVAGAQAIRDGADMVQVVNARRGARGLSHPGRLTAAEQRALGQGRLQRTDVYGRQVATTTEGTTVRGLAGQRLAQSGGTRRRQRNRTARTPRLMPEAILEIANGDRDESVRLLRRFGYII